MLGVHALSGLSNGGRRGRDFSRVVMRLGQKVTKAREMGSYRLVTLLGTGEWERFGEPVITCWHVTRPSS